MPTTKCPVCAGEVPGTALRSGTFPCPICNEPLRVREFSVLLGILAWLCGCCVTFLVGQRMGLKGYGLLTFTFFLSIPASLLVVGVIAGFLGLLLPAPLERAPAPPFDDGGILHIESPPKLRKGQQ